MRFLLDTNTCSAHLRRPAGLTHRFVQHAGNLATSSVNLGELYTWAYKQADPAEILGKIDDLLEDVQLLDFDRVCAHEHGRLRGSLLRQGIVVSPLDLMIAAVARVHDLTLVTNNVKHFSPIPGLRIENWLDD